MCSRDFFLQVRVTLLEAFAPESCRLVLQLAKNGCKACRFYRNELPPEVQLTFMCDLVSDAGHRHIGMHIDIVISKVLLGLCPA